MITSSSVTTPFLTNSTPIGYSAPEEKEDFNFGANTQLEPIPDTIIIADEPKEENEISLPQDPEDVIEEDIEEESNTF